MTNPPWLIAHRGASKEAPENTRSAFDIALSYPVDGFETDIQLTADGIPVLYHDPTLFRLTGTHQRISELACSQLRVINPGLYLGPTAAKETILRLDETLKSYAHRTRLMLEIKSYRPDQISGVSLELTLKVLEEIRKPRFKNCLENIFILSFDADVLKFAYDHAPELKYVLLLSGNADGPTGYVSIMNADEKDIRHLHGLCVSVQNLSEDLTAFAHGRQKQMLTYVCNNAGEVKRALRLNVDVIMTDHPGWLTKYFRQNL